MNRDPETTRVVRSWLEDGVTVLPDRVLDAVLDQLPATPQRRTRWPARRLPEMNTAIKLALGAAAVVAVSLLGLNLLADGSAPAVGAASPAPSASPSPSPSAEPTPGSSPVPGPPALPADGRPVTAGQYYVPVTTTLRAVLSVPDGMTFDGAWIRRPGDDWPTGSSLNFAPTITNITVDPCAAEWLDPPVGETVDDLEEALSTRSDFVDGSTRPIAVDGHVGKRLALTTPEDVDFESCAGTQYTDWSTPNGTRWRAGGPGQTLELLIIDVNVDGVSPGVGVGALGEEERVVVEIYSAPETPAEDLAELEAMVDSIRFVIP